MALHIYIFMSSDGGLKPTSISQIQFLSLILIDAMINALCFDSTLNNDI